MDPETSTTQALCGCGFFGSPANAGLCSLCYKVKLKKQSQQQNQQVLTAVAQQAAEAMTTTKINAATAVQQETLENQVNSDLEKCCDADAAEELPCKKNKKNRCVMCRKKVGLTGFDCRCGGHYCPLHRYSDAHACTFDYKALGAQEIRRKNPQVVAEKVKKI